MVFLLLIMLNMIIEKTKKIIDTRNSAARIIPPKILNKMNKNTVDDIQLKEIIYGK